MMSVKEIHERVIMCIDLLVESPEWRKAHEVGEGPLVDAVNRLSMLEYDVRSRKVVAG